MKIILQELLVLCLIFCIPAFAGGGLTHMYVAREAIVLLPDPKLQHLLLTHLDAYLVGAYYPDSGYIKGNKYGEDSHWDPFIYAFAAYLNEKYHDAAQQNPALVAFLFGCAAHRVSDEIMHRTFYPLIKNKDFQGDSQKAHDYGDIGIDLLLNIDKNQWLTQPKKWWVPVKDLVQIYHRMGKDDYTAQQIIWGNAVISLAGSGTRLIAAPAYPYLLYRMPWTAQHYTDWPVGGLLMDEQHIADYQLTLWHQLKTHSIAPITPPPPQNRATEMNNDMLTLATDAILNGSAKVTLQSNRDGSIEFTSVIDNLDRFKTTFLALHL